MATIIAINRDETNWVVGGQRVNTQEITKNTLKFMVKVWWNLPRHKLCPKTRDIVLRPIPETLVVGLRAGYDCDIE